MNVTVDQLLQIIGAKDVEIILLKKQIEELKALLAEKQ